MDKERYVPPDDWLAIMVTKAQDAWREHDVALMRRYRRILKQGNKVIEYYQKKRTEAA